jgi:hypothetical protein
MKKQEMRRAIAEAENVRSELRLLRDRWAGSQMGEQLGEVLASWPYPADDAAISPSSDADGAVIVTIVGSPVTARYTFIAMRNVRYGIPGTAFSIIVSPS